MRILVAFDKFKDALSAEQACAAACRALRQGHGNWETDACPLADGGDGFARILTAAAGGRRQHVTVTGPRGDPVRAAFGMVPWRGLPAAARASLALPGEPPPGGLVAIVEMAAASGLALLPPARRDPWSTTTFGTGELLAAAIARGAVAIVLGVGGSATNDLGVGALAALGLQFRPAGAPTRRPDVRLPVPAQWPRLGRIAGALPPDLPPIRIACDVSNPLLGPRGCVAVYGPQKGLRPADARRLEEHTTGMARRLARHFGRPAALMKSAGAGAAGGLAFGLMAATGARLVPGSDLVAAWLSLDARIRAADMVLTGEGSFDESSLEGKGTGAIVARAAALGRPAHVFAGCIAPALRGWPGLHAITPPDLPLATALRRTPRLLRAAIRAHFASTRRLRVAAADTT